MIRLIVTPNDNLVRVAADAEKLSQGGLVRVFWLDKGRLKKVGDMVHGPDSVPALLSELLRLKGGEK